MASSDGTVPIPPPSAPPAQLGPAPTRAALTATGSGAAAEAQMGPPAPQQQEAPTAAAPSQHITEQPQSQQQLAVHPQQQQAAVVQAAAGPTAPHSPLPRLGSCLPHTSLLDMLGLLATNGQAIADVHEQLQQLEAKQRALVAARQLLEQEHLVEVLPRLEGSHAGRPVAAVVVYRSFLEWSLLLPGHGPQLAQLSEALLAQLECEDESAPAAVQEVQQLTAHWLAVSAILLSLLGKHAVLQYGNWYAHAEGAVAGADVATRALKAVGDMQRHIAAKVTHIGSEGLQLLNRKLAWAWGGAKKQGSSGASGGAEPQAASSSMSDACTEDPSVRSAGSGVSVTGPAAAGGVASEVEAAEVGRSGTDGDSQYTSEGFLLLQSSEAAGAEAAAVAGPGRTGSSSSQAPPVAPEELRALLSTLEVMVLRSYARVRDQLKRRLTPLLSQCMSSPSPSGSLSTSSSATSFPTAPAPAVEAAAGAGAEGEEEAGTTSRGSSGGGALPKTVIVGNAIVGREEGEAELGAYKCWAELVGVLHSGLATLRSAGVPREVVAALMQQMLAFINAQLFNQLLLRPECCSAASARYALRGLKLLDTWLLAESEQLAANASHGHPSASALAAAGSGATALGGDGPTTAASAPLVQSPDSSQQNAEQQQQQVGPPGRQQSTDAGLAASLEHASSMAGLQGPLAPHTGAGAAAAAGGGGRPGVSLLPWAHTTARGRRAPPPSDLGMGPWRSLNHVRQALQFLVLGHKSALSAEELARHLCPALDQAQLYRLATTSWSEAPGEGASVSGEVLEQMKAANNGDTNGGLLVTCLLDDPSGPPAFEHPQLKGRIKWAELAAWTEGRDYQAGLGSVPAALVTPQCPAQVFAFLLADLPAGTVY